MFTAMTLAEAQAEQLALEEAGERFSPRWCEVTNLIARLIHGR